MFAAPFLGILSFAYFYRIWEVVLFVGIPVWFFVAVYLLVEEEW